MRSRAAPDSIETAVLDFLEAEQHRLAAALPIAGPIVVRRAALALIALEDLRADRESAASAVDADPQPRAVAGLAREANRSAHRTPAEQARLGRAVAALPHRSDSASPAAPAGGQSP